MHEGDDAERRAALSAGSQIVPRAELNIEIRQLKIYTEELRGWSFALDHEIGDSVIGSSITEPRLENLRQLDSAILADAPGTRPKSFHDLRMEHTILEEVTRLLMQFADMEHHAASEERRQAKRLSETFRVDLAPHLSIEQEQRWVMRIGTPQPSAEEQS